MSAINYGRKRKGGGAICIYDVATNSWSNPPDKENSADFPAPPFSPRA